MLLIFILLLPEIIKFARIQHMKKLGYRYEGEELVRIQEKIIELIESDITGYKIYKATGVSQYVLSQLRQGKRDVDNLTLNTTEKLYEYQIKIEENNQ